MWRTSWLPSNLLTCRIANAAVEQWPLPLTWQLSGSNLEQQSGCLESCIVVFLSPSMNTPRSLPHSSEFIVHLWDLLFDGMTYEIVTALLRSAPHKRPETRRLELWQGPTIWNSRQKRIKSHFLGVGPLIVVVCVGQMFPCITCCGLPCYDTVQSGS